MMPTSLEPADDFADDGKKLGIHALRTRTVKISGIVFRGRTEEIQGSFQLN